MSGHHRHSNDPKLNERIQKAEHRDSWTDHVFRRILHIIERFIAVLAILALLAALGMEILTMVQDAAYFHDVHNMLHNLMTIVVGLEFVRMLIDTTPANILEVLTVAITRYVILNHDNPWANVASVLCIAGLFATRRYLIRRHELKEEMVEIE